MSRNSEKKRQENTTEPSEGTGIAIPEAAKELFDKGKIGESLLILDAACKAPNPSKDLFGQRLVLQIILHGRRQEWRKVLSIQEKASEKEVKASYKRLAQQVHPDKCKCFGTEEAFQCLGEAVDGIQAAEEGGFMKEKSKEGEHSWWEKWDVDPGTEKRKRKREADAVPMDEEEMLNLRQCPIEDLKKEVARRQSQVLKPEKGSEVAKLTASQRQQRVRVARGILNERLVYAQTAPKAGGFV